MTTELERVGLSFDTLPPPQKAYFLTHIWNGVGSRHFFINPHDLIFKEASIYHDFYYWRGGPEKVRLMADKDFFMRCKDAVKKAPWHLRPFYSIAAIVYTQFLRLGKSAWEYGEVPAQNWEQFIHNIECFYDMNPRLPRPPKYR